MRHVHNEKISVAVIDGQGGGIGAAIVEKIKSSGLDVEVIALGSNAMATSEMLRAGADAGATGENAIVHNMEHVDVVMGAIAILAANSMMGEFSPAMTTAIGGSHTYKILLPLNRCHIHVVSVEEDTPLSAHLESAIDELAKFVLKYR